MIEVFSEPDSLLSMVVSLVENSEFGKGPRQEGASCASLPQSRRSTTSARRAITWRRTASRSPLQRQAQHLPGEQQGRGGRRWRDPVPLQGEWLRSVVSGYFNYHAVPTNGRALTVFQQS